MLQSPKAAAVVEPRSTILRRHRDRLALGEHQRSRHDEVPGLLPRRPMPPRWRSSMRSSRTGRARGGTFKDLFTSHVGFVTRDTAPILRADPARHTTPTRMTLDATKRPGFLTRVGFLSTFSHVDATSPILRGAFITQRVLGVRSGPRRPGGTEDACRLRATT